MSVLWYVFLSGALALATALVFSRLVSRIPIGKGDFTDAQKSKLEEISAAIAEGAMAFLNREYRVIAVFMAIFAVIVVVLVGWAEGGMVGWTSALAFLCGAGISVLAGLIGMKSATRGNVRTTAAALQSVASAFRVAFNSGAVMGFALVGLVLVGMGLVYLILGAILSGESPQRVMEALAGFGLGGSSIALFARVGGGIYTKAADVGADLVGKIEENIPEDDPRNPAVIADNVGDNVGDIAGMGADLFGSVAESTCAALVIGAVAFATDTQALLYPMLITAVGVPVALVATIFARTGSERGVEPALKRALIVSSLLMAVVMWFVTRAVLPETFTFYGAQYTALGVYYTFLTGLIAGLLMGIVTEMYTSHRYRPVKEVAHAAETGPATNIIYGIALGYRSSLIPVLLIAITIFVGYFFAGMYGIAIASLGMLGTVAIALTMDGFGPVADNAGGIAEMAGLGENIRKRTDALDSAGNTTAAIGKGFAIGSAALTALALFSAFLVRSNVHTLDMLKPIVISFLFVGALLPFVFTAMTLKSVGKAALAMIKEVRRQFATIPGLRDAFQLTQASLDKLKAGGLSRERLARLQSIVGKTYPSEEKLLVAVRELLARYTPAVPDEQFKAVINEGVVKGKPDYRACVDISTQASLREMILPGAQVILTPIVVGGLFGAEALAGLLAGSMASGVVLAISSANSGGAWDNAKKWIETGKLGGKGSDTHKAAVVGDTVGDPFKDTSGPSLNILIKLQAIISLVFAPFFAHMSSLLH